VWDYLSPYFKISKEKISVFVLKFSLDAFRAQKIAKKDSRKNSGMVSFSMIFEVSFQYIFFKKKNDKIYET
jgi:hypothetical protein